MSTSKPPSRLVDEIESRIDRVAEIERGSNLAETIEFYDGLERRLRELEDASGETPKTRARLEFVEERLDDLYETRERALEREGDDAGSDDAEGESEGGSDPADADSAADEQTVTGDGGEGATFEPSVPEIDLSDYVGREELKAELRSRVLGPYREPERIESLGLSPVTGVLFYGPPGTGKSLAAKALGGEAELSYIEVKIPDIKDRYVGGSEENVRELFDEAAANAPCVVCMDEVDALATERGDDNNATGKDDMVNAFLDEFEKAPEGVLVIGTTNRRDRIDDAFERKERFEKAIEVGLPEFEDRLRLLGHYMRTPVERPHDGDLRLAAIARETDGYSCADLHQLVDEAAWDVYERGQDRIGTGNFEAALEAVDPVEYDHA